MQKSFIINQLYFSLLNIVLLFVSTAVGTLSFLRKDLVGDIYNGITVYLMLFVSINLLFLPILLYQLAKAKMEEYEPKTHLIWNLCFFVICYICLHPESFSSLGMILVLGAYFLIDKYRQPK